MELELSLSHYTTTAAPIHMSATDSGSKCPDTLNKANALCLHVGLGGALQDWKTDRRGFRLGRFGPSLAGHQTHHSKTDT